MKTKSCQFFFISALLSVNFVCNALYGIVISSRMISPIFLLCILSSLFNTTLQSEFCDVNDRDWKCGDKKSSLMNLRYIFYDVNPPEGFNLRRDVYLRMAVFAKKLKKHVNAFMILPPWSNLYHWQSEDIPGQVRLPWSLFFNVSSLQSYAPVIEMAEFFQIGTKTIDQVYVLQHFEDTFTSRNFEDRLKLEPCLEKIPYKRTENGHVGYFWGYKNITAKNVDCLSFHGPVTQLINFVEKDKARTIMFDHAEVALHDRFGDKEHWNARKSLRFARHLIDEAINYQTKYLNWTKEIHGSPWPNTKRDAVGGDYLSVHMRRKDFLFGHPKKVPSIKGAAKQIESLLDKLELDTVFVATDAPEEEKLELKSRLKSRRVIMYEPTKQVKSKWKDGGIAIIEQIICSNARYFVGTEDSTFSFTIREEREIMGFKPETTFQRLCGDKETKCKQPARWLIVN